MWHFVVLGRNALQAIDVGSPVMIDQHPKSVLGRLRNPQAELCERRRDVPPRDFLSQCCERLASPRTRRLNRAPSSRALCNKTIVCHYLLDVFELVMVISTSVSKLVVNPWPDFIPIS